MVGILFRERKGALLGLRLPMWVIWRVPAQVNLFISTDQAQYAFDVKVFEAVYTIYLRMGITNVIGEIIYGGNIFNGSNLLSG